MKSFATLTLIIFLVACKEFFPNLHSQEKKQWNLNWPIHTDQISDRISSVFGESRWDHFHNGLDIASYLEKVHSIGDGKLLYYRYAEDDPFQEEWGSGDTVWIDHGKGAYSAYYHLHPVRKNLDLVVKQGQEIGITGNSGHSSGGHLHFVLSLDYGKRIVNPLLFLPKIIDETPPLIGGLSVHIGERFSNINSGDSIQLSDTFPFSVSILDSGVRKSQRFGVQFVQFSLNGKIIQKSHFDSIQFIANDWKNEDGISFNHLFWKDRYLVGNLSLPSGEHTIEVVATDFHGNSAVKSFTFYVTRTK
jgi:hypothetical protein